MKEINIYCDESNHLENDQQRYMVLAAVYLPTVEVEATNIRLKEIKARHNLPSSFEMKWTKVSPGKEQFYLDAIDYFFDDDDLHFRAVIIDKQQLNHAAHQQTHDDFYYKMYFYLLSAILEPGNKYNIYLDIKDSRGSAKLEGLRKVLSNRKFDFERKMIQRIQHVRSHEVNVLQIADLLAGALQFLNHAKGESKTKGKIVERVRERSSYNLQRSTLPRERKMNLFYIDLSSSD